MRKTMFAIALLALVLAACGGGGGGSGDVDTSNYVFEVPENAERFTTDSGLEVIIIEEGTGETPVPGDRVFVDYSGTFEDGSKFDSSFDRGRPFDFTLGQGAVIAGWDEGIALLKEGGIAVLIVPPDLGYGPNAYGPIPGGSTLRFEVVLVEVVSN